MTSNGGIPGTSTLGRSFLMESRTISFAMFPTRASVAKMSIPTMSYSDSAERQFRTAASEFCVYIAHVLLAARLTPNDVAAG